VKAKDKLKLLLSNTKAQVRKLKQQSEIQHPKVPVNQLFDLTHKCAPVFVLSTGRTGTQLLTNIFALSNSVIAHHEPEPTLNFFSKLAWEEAKENTFFEGIFEGARYEMLRDAVVLNKTYVETNNRITFFARHILRSYPQAKFIHLVREPEAFVKSGLGRDWYANTNIHDEGRIVKNDAWQEMNQIAKISWLWAETNRWIFEFGKSLSKDQFHVVKSEDLYNDAAKVYNMLLFCGIADVSKNAIEKMIERPVNESKIKSKSLSKEELATVTLMCNKTMKLIYD